jgi:hypothetical protein
MNALSCAVQIDLHELSRLLTAATVSKKFRHLLLTNPQQALANGYNGEVFHLDPQEVDLILSIQAISLSEFAEKLIVPQHIFENTDNEEENLAYIYVPNEKLSSV